MTHTLIIPSWYPSSPDEVAGCFFREQALALQKAGCRVGVICPYLYSLRDWRHLFTRQRGLYIEMDLDVPTYRWHATNWFPKSVRMLIKQLVHYGHRLFKIYVQRHGVPDVLHIHGVLYAGVLGKFISEKYQIPYVITEHSSIYARGLITTTQREAAISAVGNAAKLIAVSEEFCRLLDRFYRLPIGAWEYIPNIVSGAFLSVNDIKQKCHRGFTFITVCLLTPNKATDCLLRAFARAFSGVKNVRLRVGGDGPERPDLQVLANQLSIDTQVEFLGMLSRGQVQHYISDSDAFVLSSRYETFGVVLVEATALGKPVIATRCGGPESIVSDGDGYLVEVDDVEALAIAMIRLVDNIERFDPQLIRNRCAQRFSEDAVTTQLREVYREVVHSNSRVRT